MIHYLPGSEGSLARSCEFLAAGFFVMVLVENLGFNEICVPIRFGFWSNLYFDETCVSDEKLSGLFF